MNQKRFAFLEKKNETHNCDYTGFLCLLEEFWQYRKTAVIRVLDEATIISLNIYLRGEDRKTIF